MSYVDEMFAKSCVDVIYHGFSDEGFDVRPKWEDGTPAHTKAIYQVAQRYQLAPDRIPVLTVRKLAFKNAVDEILWIYQKKSNQIKDLHSHIWDSWADENGTIGKAYGYQIGRQFKHHKYHRDSEVQICEYDQYPSIRIGSDGWVWMDQMDAVLWSLKHNPADRAIMMNMYNHADLAEMGLRPCAYSISFQVHKDRESDRLVLDAILNQRSQDVLTANNWNVAQYSVLVQMIAQVCGMIPGQLLHVVANYHIYDRHIPIVKKLIAKVDAGQDYLDPTFYINPEVKNFYDFKLTDFELRNYRYCEFTDKIEVAI